MNVAGIRCNRISKLELELADSLSAFFDATYFLLDYRSESEASGVVNVVLVEPARLFPSLKVPDDWGWRCGDFCYFALQEFLLNSGLNAEKIWLVESDVVFQCDVESFFSSVDASAQFVATKIPRKPLGKWYWAPFIQPFYPPEDCFFPLTRIDVAVIPDLKKARAEILNACSQRLSQVPNDESFVASYMKASGRSFLDLKQCFSELFHEFDFSKRLVFDLEERLENPSVIHGAVRFSELIEPLLNEEENEKKRLDHRLVNSDKVFVDQMVHLAESRAAVSSHLMVSGQGGYQLFEIVEKLISALDSPEDLLTKRMLSNYFNAVLLSDGSRFSPLSKLTQSVQNRAYLASIDWKNGVSKKFDFSSPSDFTEKKSFLWTCRSSIFQVLCLTASILKMSMLF